MKVTFLIDCEYVGQICDKLRRDFAHLLQRPIDQADLPLWIECALRDAYGETMNPESETQVYLFHQFDAQGFAPFVPASYTDELDGKAFHGSAGEVMFAACAVDPKLGTKETILCETLQTLLQHDDAANVLLAVDMNAYGKRIKSILAEQASQSVTLLSLDTRVSQAFRTEQIGFSLLAALHISSEEIAQAST